jgi:hypothetical protein
MKHYLLAGLLLSAAPAAAQISTTPFKGADAILIDMPVANPEGLKKMADYMRVQGYAIDSLTDTQVVTVSRAYEFKRLGIMTPAQHRFRAVAVSAYRLMLTGTMRLQLNTIQQFESSMGWYGAKDDSQNKACFTQAQKIALAYPDARISYTKRP